MFQFVSGHTSQKKIAHYSSRRSLSQLESVSNALENHQPQWTQIFTVTNVPFIHISNRMASNVSILIATASFPNGFFNSCNIQDNLQAFSVHWRALMTKTDLTFLVLCIRFVDFAVQFYFRCKLSIPRRSIQVWQWRDFMDPSQLFVTHSNQWVCFILYRQKITLNCYFRVKYIWNNSYWNCGCRWKWRMIIAVNFPI